MHDACGTWVLIGAAAEITERGPGKRFAVRERYARGSSASTGFVIRFDGQLYAYLNRCAHVPTELDWVPGEFYDGSGLYLTCATHGATYAPEHGRCMGGPCRGGRLRPIQIEQQLGLVYWQPDEYLSDPAVPLAT